MGKYFNPPQALGEFGRSLGMSGSYEELISRCKENETLFGIYWRFFGQYFLAPKLYSKEEFWEFEKQVFAGHIQLIEYFAVDSAVAEEHISG